MSRRRVGHIAVRPEFQNNGIGAKLVQAWIDACRRAGYDVIFVLGNPDFWQRFGFAQASEYGICSEYNAEHSFLVLEAFTISIRSFIGATVLTLVIPGLHHGNSARAGFPST